MHEKYSTYSPYFIQYDLEYLSYGELHRNFKIPSCFNWHKKGVELVHESSASSETRHIL